MIKKLAIASMAVMLLSFKGMGEVLINEDFSKFTAGSEETPDGTTLTSAKTDPRWEIPAQYTNQPGWKSCLSAERNTNRRSCSVDYISQDGFVGKRRYF